MSYFLKQTKNKKGTYLQIYESYYDPERGYAAHRSYKPIGYVHELVKEGIHNPVDHYKNEVNKLNNSHKLNKQKQYIKKVTEEGAEKNIGYVVLEAVNNLLNIKKDMSYMDLIYSGKSKIYNTLTLLMYARILKPCSKRKTYLDVLPSIGYDYKKISLDQLYDVLDFIGSEYQKFIEIYNHHIFDTFKRNTNHTYYDGTNFYFEIDQEDDFRKKGPSKENRKDPIVGMGLLLDGDTIPIGMKLYPGNASEKPYLNTTIEEMKNNYNIKTKVIRVADKGLNCANNIIQALSSGDGYIFSKSIKHLNKQDQIWATTDTDFTNVYDKNGKLSYKYKSFVDEFKYKVKDQNGKITELSVKEKRIISYNPKLAKKQIREINKQVDKARKLRLSEAKKSEYGDLSKYVLFSSVDKNGEMGNNKVAAHLNHDAINKAKALAGYNMIVTSETNMPEKEIYTTYHNLWHIEETFRIMKNELEARPVYLQKESTIKGHFLVCYIAVVLLRILQVKIFNNTFTDKNILKFIKYFNVAPVSEYKYINLLKRTEIGDYFERNYYLPINNYFLKKSDIDNIKKLKY